MLTNLAPIPILLVLILLTLVYRLDEQTHDKLFAGSRKRLQFQFDVGCLVFKLC